ncbi:RraA family protein [Agrobacterium sp. MCAB5]|uniref:RraA family protein n=1 Tax=Agrobacterium sp. MCAB5 TaxID=3233042 RepID=UPI003F8E9648
MVRDLLELGTSTLSEASGLKCSLDPALRPVWKGAAFAGPAFPVSCPPGDNLAIHLAVERAPKGSVLMVDAAGCQAGYWGEVFAVAAEARGIVGLVIDGGARDIDALEARGFPVFARCVSMRGTIKRQALCVGETTTVAGVSVALGDMVVADVDGVMSIPAHHLEATLSAARDRQEKEKIVMDRLRKGETTVEILGLTHYRN